MFSQIYNVVLPVIDRFFAWFSAVATMPFNLAIDFLLGGIQDHWIQVAGFTGQTFTFAFNHNSHPLIKPIEWVASGIGDLLGVSDLPFFLALLVLFSECFVAILVGRFLFRVVTGLT